MELNLHPIQTKRSLFQYNFSTRNSEVSGGREEATVQEEYVQPFHRDDETSFGIDSVASSHLIGFQSLSFGTNEDSNQGIQSSQSDLYREYTKIQEGRAKLQNYFLASKSKLSAQSELKPTNPSSSNELSREERFQIEVQKAYGEISLLIELSSSLRNMEGESSFMLKPKYEDQRRDKSLPLSQRLAIVSGYYRNSAGILSSTLADVRRKHEYRRNLISSMTELIRTKHHNTQENSKNNI